MAGNPLAKYFPWIKTNIVPIYIGVGVFLYFYRSRTINQTYKFVYSKNDFVAELNKWSIKYL